LTVYSFLGYSDYKAVRLRPVGKVFNGPIHILKYMIFEPMAVGLRSCCALGRIPKDQAQARIIVDKCFTGYKII